jgi:hypothetical protein
VLDGHPWLRVVVIAVVVLGAVAILLNKERDVFRTGRARAGVVLLTLGAAAVAGTIGALVLRGVPRDALPERELFIAGLALSFAGGMLDKSTRAARTWIGLGVSMLFAFALLLSEAPRPLPVSHLVRSVPVAAVGGGIVGAVLRFVAGLIVKARRGARPTA